MADTDGLSDAIVNKCDASWSRAGLKSCNRLDCVFSSQLDVEQGKEWQSEVLTVKEAEALCLGARYTVIHLTLYRLHPTPSSILLAPGVWQWHILIQPIRAEGGIIQAIKVCKS